MLEQLTECPLCQNNTFENFLICRDHLISNKEFQLVKCSNCQFVFTNPRPDERSIGKYYQSEDYISHQNKSNSLINILYKIVRNYAVNKKVKLLNTLAEKGNLLDYGCGTGHFLQASHKDGWTTYGIEPDEAANAVSKKIIGDHIYNSLNDIPTISFDLITLWHVLEHIHQIDETLAKFYELLDPKGKLLIALPNYQSYDARKYQELWAGYDVPRHLYHFKPETLKKMVAKHGFYVDQILPMKFDSFYVSMLSEKYKGNAINLLKPFIIGCKSNIYAKKDHNYSSLIYILSK